MFRAGKSKPAKKGKKGSIPARTWDILTLVVVVITLMLCSIFAMILANPYGGLNPFPPATPLPTMFIPTSTPTLPPLPATWTPTPTIEPTASNTPRPTITLVPTSTLFVATSAATATNTTRPTVTPRPTGVPYTSTVSALDSATYRPDTSCTWSGVAGQVLDANNSPVIGLIVKMGGYIPSKTIYPEQTVLSGLAPAYGPSGFEFPLDVPPEASKNTLWIQLFDQSGAAISEKITLTTYKDCAKNLIFVRFKAK
jgi:hypothetical protein